MKIKAKLLLGIGSLFILIILLAALGAREINALSAATNNILVANYNTLDYTRNMLIALDEVETNKNALNKFESNLAKQNYNITEIGEKELTEKLAQDFEKLKVYRKDESLLLFIRKDLTDIMLLNMQAIERKSNVAKQQATDSTLLIALTGTFCFVISLILIFNLPGNIANPIKELTQSIKQIASMNYKERINFERDDEFGELATSFNIMAEKLQEYNSSNLAKLMFEKKRIEMLINNMHDPVIGFDENKIILFVNDEALKILGLKAEDLIDKPAQDIALTNDLMRSLLQSLINERNIEIQNNKPLKIYADNKESYFEKEIVNISIIPTGEKEAQHIGLFIVLNNITPFKELDFAKTNFIATISHELKTPISAIKASLQLLENKNTGVINDDQKELITSIKEDSNRLLKIIGELLNLSQVETGNIHLNIQSGDPNKILHYALEAVKMEADQKSIKLNVTADDQLPSVKADTEKTAWVLINLLTNAIRYSKEHSEILIEVSKINDTVLFSVKDYGKGIEAKYKDKIFTRYFQIPGSSKAGTGLGLSISKEFIEAQGGEIMVESIIGEGSKFSFSLNI
ncbi:MAG: HAMP domain-containing protein [Bacteroidia bacterium]|nr:HAMP domain-containing protein [Bacteroidia bacterium]